MDSIFEKKNIHILLETITLIGVSFYFYQKNKSVLAHIEKLVNKIEDQDDKIQNLEDTVSKLLSEVNNLVSIKNISRGNNIRKISKPRNNTSKYIPIPKVKTQKIKNVETEESGRTNESEDLKSSSSVE